MEADENRHQADAVLNSFLSSASEAEASSALADLLTNHAEPVIKKTLRSKLRVSLNPADFSAGNQEALEVAGDVKLLLVSALGRLRSNPNGRVIQSLHGYVAAVTVNAYRQNLRDKYPLRRQLRNKLRYLVSHHPEFALWEDDEGWLCGFKSQVDTDTLPAPRAILEGISGAVDANKLREASQIIPLVRTVFEFAQAPLIFNDLVGVISDFQGIKDRSPVSESEITERAAPGAAEPRVSIELEQREYLGRVWSEICRLPVRHRLAFLLNLRDRDGDCVIRLFPILRIASVREIAAALEFPPLEFASVWRELPWDDLKTAEYMNLTRQQVINLRQSARARLVRLLRE